jgi:MFS family permease
MIAMLIGGATVDRLGRRPALIYSSVAIGIGLIISGILMKFSAAQIGNNSFAIGAIVVIFIVEFIACATWLVLGYSYPNEVLSFKQRAKGTAIAQSIGYCFSVMVLYCFPIALEKIGWIYFVINGCWNVAFAIGMWFLFVETKGRTLEEIDEIFGGSVLDGVDTGNSLSESSVTTPVDQKKGAEVEITQQSY